MPSKTEMPRPKEEGILAPVPRKGEIAVGLRRTETLPLPLELPLLLIPVEKLACVPVEMIGPAGDPP